MSDKRSASFSANASLVLAELTQTLSQVSDEQAVSVISLIDESPRIFLNALGRAKYAGQAFVMRLMHMGREVYVIGETNTPNFSKDDLLIVCSGSGSTAQFLANAQKAKELGGRVLAITATAGSPLTKLADETLVLPAPSKKHADDMPGSAQPMASLFEQSILIAGDALVLSIMARAGAQGDEMFSRHANIE